MNKTEYQQHPVLFWVLLAAGILALVLVWAPAYIHAIGAAA